jgi:hypothetical protein
VTVVGGPPVEVQVMVVEFLSNTRDVIDGEPVIKINLSTLNYYSVHIHLTISLTVYSDIDVLAGSTSIRYLTAIHSSWNWVEIELFIVQAHSTGHSTSDEW